MPESTTFNQLVHS